MNKAPAFQFYAQDFLTGCTYLTNEEIGMYIKMLCKQWTDGTIPKKRLGFLVGIEWDKFSDELKQKFTDLGDYILNERLEKEREKKLKFTEKQVENGKKGGRPRLNKSSGSLANKETKPKPFFIDNPNNNQKKPLEDENEIENRNKNNEKETIKKEKVDFEKKSKIFKIPTVEEIKNYCEERKNFVDPEKFFNFYQSKGWLVGKSKMKDWKAAVRTWEKSNSNQNQQQNGNQQPPASSAKKPYVFSVARVIETHASKT